MFRTLRTTIFTLFAVFVIAIVVGLGVIYTGAYSVAATEPHTPFGRWLFRTTMIHSVREHAEPVHAPELTSEMAKQGFVRYDSHCKICHGAPGAKPSHVAQGLRPEPPDLAHTVERWQSAELFWIIKHGIRMTGMPAWSGHYNDDEIWKVVAFTQQLPGMTEAEYQQYFAEDKTKNQAHDHRHDTAQNREQKPKENDSKSTDPIVEMTENLTYKPSKLTIQVGETVTWRNPSSVVHTVTADPSLAANKKHAALPANAEPFNSGDIQPGNNYKRRFDIQGRYKYFCIPHEMAGMVAEIIVEPATN